MPSLLVDTNTDGTTLIAAPTARMFIRVLGIDLTADGQVEVTLKSGSTVIWKTYSTNDATVKGGIVLNTDMVRDLDCAPGEALVLGLDGAVSVAGTIEYTIYGQPVQ